MSNGVIRLSNINNHEARFGIAVSFGFQQSVIPESTTEWRIKRPSLSANLFTVKVESVLIFFAGSKAP